MRKHFDYEANAKCWVRRGYEGAEERVIYIQQIHELREIEDYFRKVLPLSFYVSSSEEKHNISYRSLARIRTGAGLHSSQI